MTEQGDLPRGRAHDEAVRSRQRTRATILAVLLGAFVILVFAISIAKIQLQIGKPKVEDPSQMRSPSPAEGSH